MNIDRLTPPLPGVALQPAVYANYSVLISLLCQIPYSYTTVQLTYQQLVRQISYFRATVLPPRYQHFSALVKFSY